MPQASAGKPTCWNDFTTQFPLLGDEQGKRPQRAAFNAWGSNNDAWERGYNRRMAEQHKAHTDVLAAKMTRLMSPRLLFDPEAAAGTKVARNIHP